MIPADEPRLVRADQGALHALRPRGRQAARRRVGLPPPRSRFISQSDRPRRPALARRSSSRPRRPPSGSTSRIDFLAATAYNSALDSTTASPWSCRRCQPADPDSEQLPLPRSRDRRAPETTSATPTPASTTSSRTRSRLPIRRRARTTTAPPSRSSTRPADHRSPRARLVRRHRLGSTGIKFSPLGYAALRRTPSTSERQAPHGRVGRRSDPGRARDGANGALRRDRSRSAPVRSRPASIRQWTWSPGSRGSSRTSACRCTATRATTARWSSTRSSRRRLQRSRQTS